MPQWSYTHSADKNIFDKDCLGQLSKSKKLILVLFNILGLLSGISPVRTVSISRCIKASIISTVYCFAFWDAPLGAFASAPATAAPVSAANSASKFGTPFFFLTCLELCFALFFLSITLHPPWRENWQLSERFEKITVSSSSIMWWAASSYALFMRVARLWHSCATSWKIHLRSKVLLLYLL